MKKLPVLATIRGAYTFTFTHLGAIIGLIWLPMILVTVAGFFVLQRYFDAYADALASGDIASMAPEMLGLVCYLVVALLLCAMMSVPVTQLALGSRKQGALVHFVFGATEWRLFRGVMGLVGFLLLPLLIVGFVAGLLTGGGALGDARADLAILAAILLLVLGLVYMGLRFGMLLPAVAVGETGPMLPRAWNLSAANFWRIFLVAAAILIPVWILSAAIQLAVEGPQLMAFNPESSTAMMAAQFHALALNMPWASGINFLLAPMLLGLISGASAEIYKNLNAPRNITDAA